HGPRRTRDNSGVRRAGRHGSGLFPALQRRPLGPVRTRASARAEVHARALGVQAAQAAVGALFAGDLGAAGAIVVAVDGAAGPAAARQADAGAVAPIATIQGAGLPLAAL